MERVEEIGKVWIKEKVDEATGIDLARRVKRAYSTEGLSEVRRLRNSLLGGSALSARSGVVGRVLRAFSSGFETEFNRLETSIAGSDIRRAVIDRVEHYLGGSKHAADDKDKDKEQGGKKSWRQSREEWLDSAWRHNWRSQPRDAHGRWTPGRLKHPYMTQGARKIRRKRRAAVRKAVHEAFTRDQ